MKNKIPNESIFKKKGFYVALYSCLGAVMVLAAVASFGNLSLLNKPSPTADTSKGVDFSQLEITSKSDSQPYAYLTPEDQIAAKTTPTPKLPTVTMQPTMTIKPMESAAPQKADKPASPTTTEKPKMTPEVSTVTPSPKPDANTPKAPTGQTSDADTTPDQEAQLENAEDPVAAGVDENDEPESVFNAYTDETKMTWPVLGEVVMQFSDSHAIYDQTLDQYRTNDTLCISAELGSQVVASAEGVVVRTTKTREDGNMVVIDHGNGWMTTYSQLQDGVLVKDGDVVKKGQVIGGVASPSIYSVLLGNHVGFKVTRNDELLNPLTVLE